MRPDRRKCHGRPATCPGIGETPGTRPTPSRRVCIDQSGIGMMLAEHLVQKYGAMVEPVTFTAPLKERLAPMVKQAFEERTVRIPDNREVRADINSVKRFVTLAGNVRFDAEHTDRGHADRFWALAMVVNAASEPRASFEEQAYAGRQPGDGGICGNDSVNCRSTDRAQIVADSENRNGQAMKR